MKRLIAFAFLMLGACDKAPVPDPAQKTPGPAAQSPLQECGRCGHHAGPDHLCGRTQWCSSCARDIEVENHICAKTHYCSTCRRETGEHHVCSKTEICWKPACRKYGKVIEGGTNHVCTKTKFCVSCGWDVLPGHDCGLHTYACAKCEAEVSQAHVCGKSFFCPKCTRAAELPKTCAAHAKDGPQPGCPDCRFSHKCSETSFCPECESEKPVTHHH